MAMAETKPEIQLISNMVVTNEAGEILFLKYGAEDERWWLPGDDLEPYQHPDDRAKELLDAIPGLVWKDPRMVAVESFRGRRGWHVMFNYLVTGSGSLPDDSSAAWFPQDQLPRTMHGQWEIGVIREA